MRKNPPLRTYRDRSFMPGTHLSKEKFEERVQDLLSSFDPDWIGCHACTHSFRDKLLRYIGTDERRGALGDKVQPYKEAKDA